MTELAAAIAERIRTSGPIGFDEFVAHALYAPGRGFYAAGGGAGRRRDFVTSPEVGPLFGAVVASALDRWWDQAGRPAPFTVVEAGAGPGTLAKAILSSRPRCIGALRLVLVEPAEVRWESHPRGATSRQDLPEPGELGVGPLIVLANELIDNLPFGLVELTEHGWCEVVVTLDEPTSDDPGPRFSEGHVLLDERRAGWCWGRAGREASIGTRIPVQAEAAAWLASALDLAGPGGRVVLFDYASRSADLARRPWREWLRTYAAHGRSGDPLEAPGSRDITVEVAIDQLETVAEVDSDRSQADWLRAHGIDALVEEGRARWHELGLAGGLEAIAARSRVHEADALCDPEGLGAFRVLEWTPA